MVVGFKAKYFWYQIGNDDFLHAFFSNICYHLENKEWGSKYKLIMNDLYKGDLAFDKIEGALLELKDIHDGLCKIEPSKVIWDIENLEQEPPWGKNISSDITSLGNYFITSEGDDLINLLYKALNKSKGLGTTLKIERL